MRVVAGTVARAKAVEIVEGVVEVLWSAAPVGGAVVVVVAVVEEAAVGGVASPADDTCFALSSPKVAVGAVVDHCVVGDGSLGSVL